jgi:glycosyltransferase involved in cell wall biosynthesis
MTALADAFWVALGVYAVLLVVYHGYALDLARAMPRLDPEDGAPPRAEGAPSVRVVIAARNEEEDLPACLDDLLTQVYPKLEIRVVDGGSTDGTLAVARDRAPRVSLVEEPPLPAGWVGKNWACHTGAAGATTDYLLFTDADMRYHPRAVSAAVAWAERERADLVSLAPRVEARTFWEKVVMPFYVQMVLTYFRAPRTNRAGSRAAMANGQFLLVRRGAYAALGGHEAVRDAVLEDIALARRAKDRGLRLRVAWAPELLSTRMYRDRHEMFEGLLKNVHDIRFSAARQLAFVAGLAAFFALPLAVLPVGLAVHSALLAGVGLFFWIVLFAKHAAFARGIRNSAAYGLLFPVAVGFYFVLLGVSIARGLSRRPVSWKGRRYPILG